MAVTAVLCLAPVAVFAGASDDRSTDVSAEFELAQAVGTSPADPAPRGKVTLAVPPTIQIAPGAELRLHFYLQPANAAPRNSFIKVRGVPQRVALSEGYVIAPGAWAVPLNSLATLKAIAPIGTNDRADVTVSLVDLDGNILAEARTTLIVGRSTGETAPTAGNEAATRAAGAVGVANRAATPKPPGADARIEPQPAGTGETKTAAAPPPRLELTPPPKTAQPLNPALLAGARAEAERLISQGDKFLGQGDIAVARNYYTRAADAGFAAGAMRLAETYDPGVLAQLPVHGVQPNPATARKWYERAKELGAADAGERIERLSNVR